MSMYSHLNNMFFSGMDQPTLKTTSKRLWLIVLLTTVLSFLKHAHLNQGALLSLGRNRHL